MSSSAPTIEELSARYQKLDRQRTVEQTNLENARKNLAALEAEAIEAYGTKDIKALQTMLAEMESDNERLVLEYAGELDKIQANLAAVESGLQNEAQG